MQRSLIPDAEDWEHYELPTLQGISRKAKYQPADRFKDLSRYLDETHLRHAFKGMNKKAAPGVDKVTYKDYQKDFDGRVLTAALREPRPKKLITSQCEKYLEDIFRVAGKRRQRGKKFIAYCLPSFKVLCRPTARHKPSHPIFKAIARAGVSTRLTE